jgi:hypothetical protein
LDEAATATSLAYSDPALATLSALRAGQELDTEMQEMPQVYPMSRCLLLKNIE